MPFSSFAPSGSPGRVLGLTLALVVWALASETAHAQDEKEPAMVTEGSRVSIEYTLTLQDGTVADSNVGGDALTYEQGASQILPALENELEGMKVGETKEVSLTADQGYGEVDDSLVQTVPAEAVPEEARKVGAQLLAQSPTGQQRPVRVREVKDEEIVLDLNHPLAGEALNFDVKILAIE